MKHILKTCIFLVAHCALSAQNKETNLKNYFSGLIQNNQFNGSVLVAENEKIIFRQSYGYADIERKIKITDNTRFPLASISKTITATAILQLVQAKKIAVDDPVKKVLPWFPYDNITIRQLLSHTSGLPPYNAYFDSLRKQQPGKLFTNADFRDGFLANPKPLLYTPGDKGNYDNINFIVLALVIEKVSGLSYESYIKINVLRPASMKQTLFMPFRLQYDTSNKIRFADPYVYPHRFSDSLLRATSVAYIVNYWAAYNFSGFADYISTVGDLLRYDQAYYKGELLGKKILEEAFTPVTLNNGKANARNFGLGWEISADSNFGKVVYHSGNATGLSCVIIRNISKHQTIILFDNIHANNAETIGFDLLKILNGVHVPMPAKSIADAYGREIIKNGPAAARAKLFILKNDSLHYYLSEDEMNLLGYDLMGGPNNPNPYHFPEVRKYQEALETFKLNMELFPQSWNAYDSYGEILLKMGYKNEAIRMYQKSIELNPGNEGGKKVLDEILKMP